MLKDSKKEVNNLEKLHRERTRWVTATWVLGALFVVSVIIILSLGFYIARPEFAQELGNAGEGSKQGVQQEPEEPLPIPKVSGVTVDDDPVKGSPDAAVTIIEFSDFLCPFCAASSGFREDLQENMKSRDATWEAAIPKVIEEYVDTGKAKFVFRDAPFHGDASLKAAEASQCADDQDKYWEMHDLLFARQQDFPSSETELIGFLKGLAKELGLVQADFDRCLDEGKYTEEVNKDLEAAKAAGVTGTPSYFINGRKVVGAQSYSSFKAVIEAELAGGTE